MEGLDENMFSLCCRIGGPFRFRMLIFGKSFHIVPLIIFLFVFLNSFFSEAYLTYNNILFSGIQQTDSLEETLMLGKIEGRRRRG